MDRSFITKDIIGDRDSGIVEPGRGRSFEKGHFSAFGTQLAGGVANPPSGE